MSSVAERMKLNGRRREASVGKVTMGRISKKAHPKLDHCNLYTRGHTRFLVEYEFVRRGHYCWTVDYNAKDPSISMHSVVRQLIFPRRILNEILHLWDRRDFDQIIKRGLNLGQARFKYGPQTTFKGIPILHNLFMPIISNCICGGHTCLEELHDIGTSRCRPNDIPLFKACFDQRFDDGQKYFTSPNSEYFGHTMVERPGVPPGLPPCILTCHCND
jgi:hypothetical protein